MPGKKTVFVSDIHLGPGNPWDWFNIQIEGRYLVSFFEYLATRRDVKEIVLLGDVFDLWVCPHNDPPHIFDNILLAHKDVMAAITKTAAKIPTLYINGNHDFEVTPEMITEAFGGKVTHVGDIYRRRNLHAEHGHRHALFNCPDPKNGGHLRLPVGYYITRLHTTLKKMEISAGVETRHTKFRLVYEIIDEAFQVMGPEKLPESILDALRDSVVKLGEPVVKFNMGNDALNEDYLTIRDRYRNLYQDWFEAVGFWRSTQMIMSELNRLGSVADSLCKNGVRMVVFGHSHGTKMDKDSILVDNRIYANCGYWCGFGDEDDAKNNAHFVESDCETQVALYSFREEKPKLDERLKLS
ncbi:MAG: hypothetical protein V1792_27670 [Pseudomonadota bacterium]